MPVALPVKDLVPGMFIIIDEYWRGFSYVFIISVDNRHKNLVCIHYMKNGRVHVIKLGTGYDFTTHASIVVKP